MTSRRLCNVGGVNEKRQPCWRSEIFLWGLNSIFMQIPPFVSLCKYGFCINKGHKSQHTISMRALPTIIISSHNAVCNNYRGSDVSQQMSKWPIIFSLIFSSTILMNFNISKGTTLIYQFLFSFRWSGLFFHFTF